MSMHNVAVERQGEKLVITVDVSKQTVDSAPFSKTGKSKLVASSGGFYPVGDNMAISLNVSRK